VWRRNGGSQGKKEKRKVVPKVFLQEIEPCTNLNVCGGGMEGIKERKKRGKSSPKYFFRK
jgi:hypothetical protein